VGVLTVMQYPFLAQQRAKLLLRGIRLIYRSTENTQAVVVQEYASVKLGNLLRFQKIMYRNTLPATATCTTMTASHNTLAMLACKQMTIVTIDLDRLRSDIEKLKVDKAELDQEIAELEAAERAAVSYGKTHANGTASQLPGFQSGTIVVARDVTGKTLFEAAAIVVQRMGGAVKTRQIVDALRAAKYGGEMKNLQSAVFTAMTRKPEIFKKAGPGEWTVRDDYRPHSEDE